MKRFYTLLVILTLFSSYIHVAGASDAAQWMPDANLRTAVRASLGLADNEDLTQAKMLDLTELKAAGRGISNITGLEHATNVTIVRLAGNQISNLSPLSGLTSLMKLRLQGNEITNITSLSGLTNLTELFLNDNQITDVTPLTNLVNLTTLRLAGNSLTNAHLLSSLTNLNSIDITIPDPPSPEPPADVDPPGVTVSVPSGVQTGVFDVTITFAESVSGFTRSDLSLSGTASASITSWSTTDDTTYTATITPTSSGSVTLNVSAGVAIDAANNSNTAAPSKTVTVSVDTDAPGVSVSVPSGVQNGAFNVTITFTEAVSGFTQSDLSLSGTASASITSWSSTGNTTYTTTITPTYSGTVTLNVAAGIATDGANNQNTAATSQTVDVDVDAPTVTIGAPSGTQTGAFDATITFSETVSGFTQSDVSLNGSAASITGWSANSDDAVYTATITPTASGTVTLGVAANVATDAANNQNTAATSQTVTIALPETIPDPATWMPDANLRAAVRSALSIASNANFSKNDLTTLTSLRAVQSQVTNLTGLEYATNLTKLVAWQNQISSLTPLEDLTGLTEIRIGNNQISDVTPLDDLTSLTKLALQHNNISNVTPLAGLVNLTWLRLAGNPISDLSPLVTLVKVTDSDVDLPEPDTTAPSVSISVPSGVQSDAFEATITFTESVSGFTQSDLSLTGTASASITAWSTTDNITYTATITPTTSGAVTLSVAANVATDAANNPNTAATSQTVTVSIDTDAPGVNISVPSGVQNGAFDVTITFTEAVSGFVQGDVSLLGAVVPSGKDGVSDVDSTASASITAWSTTDNTTYTATITPTTSGTVTLNIAANVATDAANNQNTAATSQTVTVDVDRPTTTIGVPSGTQTSVFDVTITFSETVSDFVQSDVSLTGSAASITAWSANNDNTVYTATITPTANGTVTVGVAANVATDAANNPNTPATSQTVTVSVDTEAPSVSISVPSGVQTGAFDATITFSETVSGFVGSDVSLTGSAASITAWGANSDNTVYTATITPTASGAVTLGVAANVATDGANNPNTAATSQTVTVDVDVEPPGVSITVPSEAQRGAFATLITFTEEVSGFEQTDLSLAPNTAGATITTWVPDADQMRYVAVITPTTSGEVTFNVAAGVATDAANNPNTAATSKTVTVDVDAPTVTVGVPSGTQTGAFDATITFSETVSGFVGSDVSLSGSAASITAWRANSNNTVYTATITPTASGTVTIGVAANVATDAAGNNNTAATSKNVTVSVDTTAPGVSITVPSGVQNSAFEATITFTEAVSGFVGFGCLPEW